MSTHRTSSSSRRSSDTPYIEEKGRKADPNDLINKGKDGGEKKKEESKEPELKLIEDEGFQMRMTVRKDPKKDKEGNVLDKEDNINKSRGVIGIMSNEKVNPETKQPLTVQDIQEQEKQKKAEDAKNLRLANEQQKMLRFEMQGRIADYKPPEEFADHPLLKHPAHENKKPAAVEQTVDTKAGEQVVEANPNPQTNKPNPVNQQNKVAS